MAKYSASACSEISYTTFDAALDKITLHQAMSCYLLVLVPLLAYFLATGTDLAGALLTGRFLQPSEGLEAGFTRSAVLDNWTMDRVDTAPQASWGAARISLGDISGNVTTTAACRRQFLDLGSRTTATVQGT